MQRAFFDREVTAVARDLIGSTILFERAGGIIVETEAYDRHEEASHSFRGMTPRNRVMFGPPGHAYVYRSYGIHWCLNFVCQQGCAVLIRAVEPTVGLEAMAQWRGMENVRLLCSGPGRLCQAMGISIAHNGLDLLEPPLELSLADRAVETAHGLRIGITKAVDYPWRYVLKGSPFISRKLTTQ